MSLAITNSSSTESANRPRIAIWGTPKAGKTTYLAALWRYFKAVANIANDSDFRDRSLVPWRMKPWNNTNQWLEDTYANWTEYGVFSVATQPGNHNVYTFDFDDLETKQHILQLDFLDVPGEAYRDPEGYKRLHDYDVIGELKSAAGILMLLDAPAALDRNHNQAMAAFLRTLLPLSQDENGKPRQGGIPIAYCLTKCDERGCQDALQNPKQFAKEKLPRALVDLPATLSNVFDWFACSAIGFEPGHPPNLFTRWDGKTGIRYPDRIAPIGVAEPLKWLAEHVSAPHSDKLDTGAL